MYATNTPSTAFDIFTVDPDGSDVTQLTTAPGFDMDPAWSPNGSRIAFWSRRDDPGCQFSGCNDEIYVMNADGSGQTRLTNSPGADVEPAWSPDGTKIASRPTSAVTPTSTR